MADGGGVRLPVVVEPEQVRCADDVFRCDALAASLRARVCVDRQHLGDVATQTNSNRGLVPYFPSCSDRCSDGALIRRRLRLRRRVTSNWQGRWFVKRGKR